MPDHFIVRISLTPGLSVSPLASSRNEPVPPTSAMMKLGSCPEAMLMLPFAIFGRMSLVLWMARMVTCSPCGAKIPCSCAMYIAAPVSAGTAPTTTFVFGPPLAGPDVPGELHDAASVSASTLRTAVVTSFPLGVLIFAPWLPETARPLRARRLRLPAGRRARGYRYDLVSEATLKLPLSSPNLTIRLTTCCNLAWLTEVGKVPMATEPATAGVMCRLATSALERSARLLSAILLASRMEAVNAAAVFGYFFIHAVVAVYPAVSMPCAAPWSVSATSWAPYLALIAEHVGSVQ